jgi:glyoxylase-like metal-dependent hydrolase (beta-lactamase superfamily II)
MAQNQWRTELLLAGSWRGATSTLLTDGRRHIVVDTGMPHEAPLLVKALRERGIASEDVSGVIDTHFHVDHVLNNFLFPNAMIYASQQSYDWCCALYSDLKDEANWEKLVLKYYPETYDYEHARTHMHKLRKLALRWWDTTRLGDPSKFRWVENHPLPEGLDAIVTSGHVPGHVSIVLADGDTPRTVIAGDALLSREHEDQVLTMIPHNREQFLRDRARILALAGRIVPGHGSEFSTTSDTRDELSLGSGNSDILKSP